MLKILSHNSFVKQGIKSSKIKNKPKRIKNLNNSQIISKKEEKLNSCPNRSTNKNYQNYEYIADFIDSINKINKGNKKRNSNSQKKKSYQIKINDVKENINISNKDIKEINQNNFINNKNHFNEKKEDNAANNEIKINNPVENKNNNINLKIEKIEINNSDNLVNNEKKKEIEINGNINNLNSVDLKDISKGPPNDNKNQYIPEINLRQIKNNSSSDFQIKKGNEKLKQ